MAVRRTAAERLWVLVPRGLRRAREMPLAQAQACGDDTALDFVVIAGHWEGCALSVPLGKTDNAEREHLGRALADDEAVHEQQDHRSHDGADESRTLARLIPADGLAEIGSDERAGDPEQRRQDESHVVAAWMDELGNHAGQKPDDDGPDETHDNLLTARLLSLPVGASQTGNAAQATGRAAAEASGTTCEQSRFRMAQPLIPLQAPWARRRPTATHSYADSIMYMGVRAISGGWESIRPDEPPSTVPVPHSASHGRGGANPQASGE